MTADYVAKTARESILALQEVEQWKHKLVHLQ